MACEPFGIQSVDKRNGNINLRNKKSDIDVKRKGIAKETIIIGKFYWENAIMMMLVEKRFRKCSAIAFSGHTIYLLGKHILIRLRFSPHDVLLMASDDAQFDGSWN